MLDLKKLDQKLSDNYKKMVATAIALIFLVAAGTLITCYMSYTATYVAAFVALGVINGCVVRFIVIRNIGKPPED